MQIDSTRLIAGVVLVSLVGLISLQWMHESRTQAEIGELKTKVAILEIEQKKSHRHSIFKDPSKESAPLSGLKEKVFKELYRINGAGEGAKKIKFLPGELLVQDVHVVNQDSFYDLLGVLTDDDAISKIELPANAILSKADRIAFQKLRKELVQFGIFQEKIAPSSDGQFRIVLDHPDLK